MNKKIMIIILIIFIIAIIGAYILKNPALIRNGKTNTEITVLYGGNMKNGDIFEFQLNDLTGKPISNQSVNLTYDGDRPDNEYYSIRTDREGKGYLVITGEGEGEHSIKLTYSGNDKYNPCTSETIITIDAGSSTAANTAKTPANSTESTVKYNNDTLNSTPPHRIYYDSTRNVYYNNQGLIVRGQGEGTRIIDFYI